jgi:hypothetical protein
MRIYECRGRHESEQGCPERRVRKERRAFPFRPTYPATPPRLPLAGASSSALRLEFRHQGHVIPLPRAKIRDDSPDRCEDAEGDPVRSRLE